MFREIKSKYVYMMETPEVVRVTMLLNLIDAVLQQWTVEKSEQVDRATFEKVYIFAIAWSMGGLFETDDRVKFHKEILEKAAGPNLPQISAQKQISEKETIFDYCIDVETKQW